MFYFILETEICNFDNDNTIYACDSIFSNVCNRLENDLHILSCWFQNNSLVANPAKFQLMFLGKNIPEDFSFSLLNQIITAKNEVGLLGIIIDSKPNFSNHIKRGCQNVNNKISVLLLIRNSLSIPQAKLICNAFILSFFYYCPAIWMFCKKSSMNLITKTHKRALRAVYNDASLSLQDLSNCLLLRYKMQQIRKAQTPVFFLTFNTTFTLKHYYGFVKLLRIRSLQIRNNF